MDPAMHPILENFCYTGLFTKDETSETTFCMLIFLVLYKYNCKLVSFFDKSQNKQIKDKICLGRNLIFSLNHHII